MLARVWQNRSGDIAKQKPAQDMMVHEGNLLRVLMDNIPGTIYFKDTESRFTRVNEAQARVLGVKDPKEAVGKTDFDFYSKEFAQEAYMDEKKILETGKPLVNKIEKIKMKDGRTRWVSATKIPIKNDAGQVTGLVGFSRDITERKKAETALSESEGKYRNLVERANDAVILIQNGLIKYANPYSTKLTGYTVEEVVDTLFTNYLHPDEVPKVVDYYRQRMKGKKVPLTYETAIMNKDNTKVDVEINAGRINYEGKPADLVIIRDVTDRKNMEEALAHERDLLHALMDNIPDTIYFKDTESRFTRVNEAQAHVLGVKDPKEAVGKTDFDFFTEEHAKDAYADEQKIIETKKPLVGKIEKTERPDGYYFWTSSTKVPIKNETGEVIGLVGISRDITEQKKAERDLRDANSLLAKNLAELERLQQELQTSNRLLKQSNTDLENYTYVVSHDLKAPLRAIRSLATFLLEDYGSELDETGQGYLKGITDAVSHMDALIGDLLLLSRVGRKYTRIERVDLNRLLDEIIANFKPEIEKRNAEVIYSRLPVVSVQRTWIRQLLMNLIDNGLKFNKSESPRVEVLCHERKEDYLFMVRDNGIGIEKKYFDRIFSLFERLHPRSEYDGTGAGLTICKRIVENFGGEIWVESTPGEGSTFLFTLPKNGNNKKGETET